MDYRFKISGDSNPFKVELYNADTSQFVCRKAVEFSDTCVILNNLAQNTCYYANIFNTVDNIILSGVSFLTPTQVTPAEIPEITFGILGTPAQPSGPPSGTVCCVSSPKLLDITPPLGASFCACVCARTSLENSSGSVSNSVTFYKSCNGGSFSQLINYSSNGTYNVSVDVGENDAICYIMSSTYTGSGGAGSNQGSATIEITGVEPKAGSSLDFTPIIDPSASAVTTNINYTIATTTTTTTQSPITISFVPRLNKLFNGERLLTFGVSASPSLQSNQCVELCFDTCAKACTREFNSFEVCSSACLYDAFNDDIYGAVDARIRPAAIAGDQQDDSTSLFLKQNNVDDITITLKAKVTDTDIDKDVYACTYFEAIRLDKECNGIFSLSGTRRFDATRVGLPLPSGNGGGLPVIV
jgi:hypothetical protein